MSKLTIVCAGKMKETYQKEEVAEFVKRLSKYFVVSISEVPDVKIKENVSETAGSIFWAIFTIGMIILGGITGVPVAAK